MAYFTRVSRVVLVEKGVAIQDNDNYEIEHYGLVVLQRLALNAEGCCTLVKYTYATHAVVVVMDDHKLVYINCNMLPILLGVPCIPDEISCTMNAADHGNNFGVIPLDIDSVSVSDIAYVPAIAIFFKLLRFL